MHAFRIPRTALVAVVLALGAGLGACGRENEEAGNPGQEPQTPGVTEGTNPAVQEEREEDSP